MEGPPSKATTPDSGVSSPLRHRSTVVLPEPLGPISTTTSPRRTSKSTPATTRLVPKLFWSPVTCSNGRSSGGAGGASGSPLWGSVGDIAVQPPFDHALPRRQDEAEQPVDEGG